jgi:predicted dehydrogenase
LVSKDKIKIKRKSIVKLRWGAAGCGNFTEFGFLPALNQLKRSKLISVYSSDINRAKSIATKFNAEAGYNNYSEFLQSNINAVYIGSRNSDHHSQVIQAAEAGKNILCEKPLALNSAQAEEMVKVCEENNVFLAINFVHRFHPLSYKANEIINKGMLGKIVSVSVNFNVDYPPNNNFRFKKEQSGGGALRDIGTHMIDLLRFFGGEITDVKGFVDNIVYKSEVDDFSAAVLKYKKGGYGQFNVSFNNPKAFNRIEILGYNGCISIENIIGGSKKAGKLTINLKGEGKKAFRRRANKQLVLLRSIQKSFIKNEQPEITGNDGLINMRIMEELEQQCL